MEYKNYNIQLHKATANYTIHGIGKGALPKVLGGLFTTPAIAKLHIDRYLNSKSPSTSKE